ncbi:LLM class flavin-dependent oxidoreductase [soil metagenome]
MILGLFMHTAGYHEAGWRHPDAQSATESLAHLTQIAQIAERGKLHMLFFGDGLSTSATTHPSMLARLEPLTALSALAVQTKHIGLAASATTTFNEPYNVARIFASLDHISGGRAGWNVVTSGTPRDAGNFSRSEHLAHDLRYERAEEFFDVVTGLWDTWEEGALVREKERGVYVDVDRLYPQGHRGAHFQVAGPLNVSRPPQGHPVIIQAGSSVPGQALAARIADLVFTAQYDQSEAQAFYRGIKAQVVAHGRRGEHALVLPGLMPIVGRTLDEAHSRFEQLQGWVDPRGALAALSLRMGTDMSRYELDAPVPAGLPDSNGMLSRARLLSRRGRLDGMTLRELHRLVAGTNGHHVVIGTPESIADEMQSWVDTKAADGFNLVMPYFQTCLVDFVDLVVPILQKRGLFRIEYAGNTLRANLGLPASRPNLRHPRG